MVTVKVFDNELKNLEINVSDIVSFRIVNRVERTTKGQFKAFRKRYVIQVGDNLYNATEFTVNALKEALKGKYETEKHIRTEYKGFTEKKATDWTYRMIR